jgi:hypothetical protein
MIHHQRFPPSFRQQNPQVVLANRAPGAEGKPTKGQSRPLILSNQPTSGTFTKNRGLRTTPTRTTPKAATLKAKKFKSDEPPRRSWENLTSATPSSKNFGASRYLQNLNQREACPLLTAKILKEAHGAPVAWERLKRSKP